MKKIFIGICLVFLLISCSKTDVVKETFEKAVSKTEAVKEAIEKATVDDYVYNVAYSEDMQSQSYVVEDKNSDFYLVKDGVKSQKYDDILNDSLKYSPDGKNVGFIVSENDLEFIVLNGEAEKKYDGVYEGTLVFSDDSSSYAYLAFNYREGSAEEESEIYLIKDGEELLTAYDINDVSYTLGTNKLNYLIDKTEDGPTELFLVEEKQKIDYIGLDELKISEDGTSIFYVVFDGEEESYTLIKNGTKVENSTFEIYYDLQVSADGTSYFAHAYDDGSEFIVKDGAIVSEKIRGDNEILLLAVSKNFEKFAYTASTDSDREVVFYNGEKSQEYDEIYYILFSPNSKHFAYDVEDGDEEYFTYLNGKKLDGNTDFPYFTPDSKKFIYILGGGDNHNTVESIDL